MFGAFALAMLVGMSFTLLFASRLPLKVFAFSGLWLIFLIFLIWLVGLLRIGSDAYQASPERKRALFLKPGAFWLVLLFALLSTILLIFNLMAEPLSTIKRMHLVLQLGLMVSFLGLLIWQFIELQVPNPKMVDVRGIANLSRYDKLVGALSRLENGAWLSQAVGMQGPARLRTAISWWREEILGSLPRRADVLNKPGAVGFLEEAEDILNDLMDLAERKATDTGEVHQAEERVIASMSKIETLAI
ncbi:MAG: hypothetical protein AAGF15_09840 [Pseudomonadota bacterium]